LFMNQVSPGSRARSALYEIALLIVHSSLGGRSHPTVQHSKKRTLLYIGDDRTTPPSTSAEASTDHRMMPGVDPFGLIEAAQCVRGGYIRWRRPDLGERGWISGSHQPRRHSAARTIPRGT